MFKPNREFSIGRNKIGLDHPTYMIADISANHDGDIERAKALIHLAAEAGADAAKFQHFKAETIVSDYGFKSLGNQKSHQAEWKKSVFEVYDDASVNPDWTPTLIETCKNAGIDFFTSPYSMEIVDELDPHIVAYKIGSGDVTWTDIIGHMASKDKPYILATGASTMDDVIRAVDAGLEHNPNICLMQCNTNYTASPESMKHIQLNVLKTYAEMYPDMVLGLSDHTHGHATALGAIALGARMIEKHFTDDTTRIGPDHKFSMDPKTWREMVDRSRELEAALGTGVKKVEGNEGETVVLQRRSIRLVRDMDAGEVITEDDLTVLRPCPADGLEPYRKDEVIGKTLSRAMKAGEHVRCLDLS